MSTKALLGFVLLAACHASADVASPGDAAVATSVRRGPYLGEEAGTTPRRFGGGVISTAHQELNAAFSPSGTELFFTLADPGRTHYTLVFMRQGADGVWSEPAVAPFSGRYADADPLFAPDDSRLYFISRRPLVAGQPAKPDFDIWYVDRVAAGWAEPVSVGAPVNTSDDEFYVSVTNDHSLYWSRNGDVHRGVVEAGGYRVEVLGPEINGQPNTSREGDPYVSPDESYLIFPSWGRPDSLGSSDLYISFRKDGAWLPAQSLGPSVNSEWLEYCPIVSPDGRYFFFTSYRHSPIDPNGPAPTIEQLFARYESPDNGMGNVYWMTTDFLQERRAQMVGSP